MNIFYYSSKPGALGDELLCSVGPLVPPGSLEVFEGMDTFSERMRRLKDPRSVAMIVKPTRKDLRSLAELRGFMKETRILLVLPDQRRETISLALKVFPSFVGYSSEDIPSILSVLRQLSRSRDEEALTRSDIP